MKEVTPAVVDEIGEAVIGIGADTSQFSNEVEGQLGNAGTSGGSRFSKALKTAAKRGAQATAVAVGAAMVGGIKSAIDQETAKKVLSGLYGSTKQATDMMKNLRRVTKTSPIDYSSYTKAAESLAYAGVKGKDAVKTLRNVGLAVTAAGGGSEQIQGATDSLLKMVNAGKVNLDSLQQLSNTGVPILSGLAKHFGVSIDKVNKMASAGKIGLDDVLSVMKKGTGKTFQQMIASGKKAEHSFGNTFKAVKDNIVTTIGTALVPVLEKLTPVMEAAGTAIAGFVEGMQNGTGPGGKFVSIIKSILKPIENAYDWLDKNRTAALALGIALGATTTAYVAYYTATKIAANWTTIMAKAHRALSLVMKASVFGLIVIALAALVLGLIEAYKHSETFRKIVQKVWAAIKVAVKATIDWFVNVAWPAMQKAMQWIAEKATWLWQNAIKPAFEGIAKVVSWAWTNIIKPTLEALWSFLTKWVIPIIKFLYQNVVKPMFTLMGKTIKAVWDGVIHPVLNALWAFVKTVVAPVIKWLWNTIIKPSFKAMGSFIKATWKNVIHPALSALKRMIDQGVGPTFRWLYNKVIKPVWNSIKAIINNTWKYGIKPVFSAMERGIKSIKKVFSKTKDKIGQIWGKLENLAKKPVKFVVNTVIGGLLRTIGKVPGLGALKDLAKKIHVSWDTGGYTGPGSRLTPAGIVHADEFVVRKAARRRFESQNPGALDHLNRTGQLPGYAGGGRVGGGMSWPIIWKYVQKHFPGVMMTSNYRPGAMSLRKSSHALGTAIDIGGSRGAISKVMTSMMQKFGRNMRDMIYSPLWGHKMVSDGRWITTPDFLYRQHFNHGHIGLLPGRGLGGGPPGNRGSAPNGAGGGGWGVLSTIKNAITGGISKLTEKFDAGGIGVKAAVGVAKKVPGALWGWAKDKLMSFIDPRNWFGESAGDAKSVGIKEGVKAIAASPMFGFGADQWPYLNRLVQNESGWNPRARNPSSGAYGLFQALPPSKMNSVGSDWRTNWQTQANWGLRYIKNRYGSPMRAFSMWMHRHPHWYDDGGWLPPGATASFNGTGSPEAVLTGSQWANVERLVTQRPEPSVHIENLTIDASTLASIETVGQFLEMLEKESMRTRFTRNSGYVPA